MRFIVSRDRGKGTWTTSRPHAVIGKLMLTTLRVPAGTHPIIDGLTTRLHLQPPGQPRDPEAQEIARYGGIVIRITPTLGVTVAWQDATAPSPSRVWSKLPTWLQPLLRPLVLRDRHRARFGPRIRAGLHELRCTECRVSWRSWLARLAGRE